MDAHLLENLVVEENQQLAFNKYQKTLQAYEFEKKAMQTTLLELSNQISTLEQAIEKVSEKIDNSKSGRVTQTVQKAKKQRAKKRKKLKELKRSLSKEKCRFENLKAVKNFKKARTELMNIHGPMETRFVQLGFISSKKMVAAQMGGKRLQFA